MQQVPKMVPISPKRDRDSDEGGSPNSKRSKSEYSAGGLKCYLHGIAYQQKLLMLFVKRGLDLKYNFKLATEMVAAGKFDDVVFQYKDKKVGDIYRFLQAKHKQKCEKTKEIRRADLLKTEDQKDNDFSLQKYFSSYRKIKQNPNFKGELKEFAICTNIDIESHLKKVWFEEKKLEDNILKFDDEKCKRYNLNAGKVLEDEELVSTLKNVSEHHKLATILAEHTFKHKPLHLTNPLLKCYHVPLVKEKVLNIINNEGELYAKFHDDFLREPPQKLKKLKTAIIEAYSKIAKQHGNIQEKMKEIKLKVSSNFGKEEGTTNELPNDYDITDEEIKCFFEKLVFVVNTPDEIKLGNIIKDEIGDYINLIDSDIVASEFEKVMLDWMKEENTRFFTSEEANSFFEKVEGKIKAIRLSGLTEHFRSKIDDLGIAFDENQIQNEITRFLKSSKKVFNIINTHKTTLSSIKVVQTIMSSDDYSKHDSCICVQLSCLLVMEERVINTFKSKGLYNLLVIECDDTQKNVDLLLNKLLEVPLDDDTKKIIFITQEKKLNVSLSDKFKDSELVKCYSEVKDVMNNFADLTTDSQEKILNEKMILFHGEEINIAEIIDDDSKYLIDGEVLSKLIDGEPIEIGKSLVDSKYKHYIDRSFSRCEEIKDQIKYNTKFCIIEGDQSALKDLQSNQDIVLISDTDDTYTKLCALKNYEKHHIHWLKTKGGKFMWQRSRGDLSKLREFVNTDTPELYEPKKFTDIAEKVVIIATSAGMGKTTLLTHLSSPPEKFLWHLRLNLTSCSSYLNENKIEFDEIESIKFLYQNAFQLFQRKKDEKELIESILNLITIKDNEIKLKSSEIVGMSLLEIKFFAHFYNKGKVILLFDGFDEICPDYKDQVIRLMQTFKKSKARTIWITTRSYDIINELEEKLNTFSYELKPLSLEDQRMLLKKYWQENSKLELDNKKIVDFTYKIINNFSQDNLFANPLLTTMVAEIFQKAFKKFYDSGEYTFSNELSLVKIYENFFEMKYHKIYIDEKSPVMDPEILATKIMIDYCRKKFIKDHKKLAVFAVLENEQSNLLSEQEIGEKDELIADIKQLSEKMGIIDQVIDVRPKFFHRTFAEYFVAKLIYEKLQKNKNSKIWIFLLDHILCNENCNMIRKFIDSYLDVKVNPLKEYWRSVEINPLDYKEQLLRAVKEGLGNISSFLLHSEKEKINYGELITVPRKHIKELCDNGQYGEADKFQKNAVKLLEKELGDDHFEVAIMRRYQGNAYGAQAENRKNEEEKKFLFKKKMDCLKSALCILEKHINVARGNYYDAREKYFHQALSTIKEYFFDFSMEQISESDWITVLEIEAAKMKRNLAVVYRDLGNIGKTKDILEKEVISTFKKYLDDPVIKRNDTLFIIINVECARAKRNLGNVYGDMNFYYEKIQFLEEALEINKYLINPKPDNEKLIKSLNVELLIAESKRNLGNAYGKSGDNELKKKYLEEALPILKDHYGFRHNKVIKAQGNLSKAYERLKLPLHASIIDGSYNNSYYQRNDELLTSLLDLAVREGHTDIVKRLLPNKTNPIIQIKIKQILPELEKKPFNKPINEYTKNKLKSVFNDYLQVTGPARQ